MKTQPKYPQLDHLIGAYLNQDYEISGDTIEAVIACYAKDRPLSDHQVLLADIERFSRANEPDLDEAFIANYGFDFDPALWGLTTAAFFAELLRILGAPTQSVTSSNV